MTESALSHHAMLILLLQLAVLLGLARTLGEVARRFGWPAVVGELLAGIFLGPTLLGAIWPAASEWLFPGDPAQNALLTAVGRLGVLLLLLVTGMEIDLGLVLSRGRKVLVVSFFGTVVPLACGFGLGMVLPDLLLQDPQQRTLFGMFLAVAMSISALAVLAKVLFDIQVMGRELSQSMVAIAMTEDLVGWILLSLVVGFAAGTVELMPAVRAIGSAIAFLVVAFTIGRRVVGLFLTWVDNRVSGPSGQISAVVVLMMLSASATHALHLEPMLGALVMGMLVAQARRFQVETEHSIKILVASFLSPVFFASAGLKVNLLSVLDPTVFGWGALVLAVAFASKLLGAYLGGWMAGFNFWERAALGVALNARGSMEIIVATVGLNLGILTTEMYSVVVLIAVTSCLFTPPMLRAVYARIPLTGTEQMKLTLTRHPNFWHGYKRLLLPLRGGPNAAAVAQIAAWLDHVKPTETTLLHVRTSNTGSTVPTFEQLREHLELCLALPLKVQITSDRQAAAAIIKESGRGYQLMMLGAAESATGFFNALTDEVVRDAACPIALVRGPLRSTTMRKILLPTCSNCESTAVDLAAALSSASEAELVLVHVVEMDEHDSDARSLQRLHRLASNVLEQHAEIAHRLTSRVEKRVVLGENTESAIHKLLLAEPFDLLVLPGAVHRTTRRVFLGPRTERLLVLTDLPVLVVCS